MYNCTEITLGRRILLYRTHLLYSISPIFHRRDFFKTNGRSW